MSSVPTAPATQEVVVAATQEVAVPATQEVAVPATQEVAEEPAPVQTGAGAKKPKRLFTVVKVDGKESEMTGGKFWGSVPSSSARKSANQICKKLYGEDDCEIIITVKEITKGRENKEYTYLASRKRNDKAVSFSGKSGSVEIPFKYTMAIKKFAGEKEI